MSGSTELGAGLISAGRMGKPRGRAHQALPSVCPERLRKPRLAPIAEVSALRRTSR